MESGCVSIKNEVNIMMKNIIDIVLGGFTYWVFGYGLQMGRGPLSNPFVGVGDFLVDPSDTDPLMGPIFTSFLFQLSFSTTATTIVSGAMAERCNFKAYCIFSFLNTLVYCIPAGWVSLLFFYSGYHITQKLIGLGSSWISLWNGSSRYRWFWACSFNWRGVCFCISCHVRTPFRQIRKWHCATSTRKSR